MYKLELLSRIHDRDSFDCGSDALNAYLRETACQHTERGISRTFVLVEEAATDPKPILGFFTLNICQLSTEQLPAELARRMPREVAGQARRLEGEATTGLRQAPAYRRDEEVRGGF